MSVHPRNETTFSTVVMDCMVNSRTFVRYAVALRDPDVSDAELVEAATSVLPEGSRAYTHEIQRDILPDASTFAECAADEIRHALLTPILPSLGDLLVIVDRTGRSHVMAVQERHGVDDYVLVPHGRDRRAGHVVMKGRSKILLTGTVPNLPVAGAHVVHDAISSSVVLGMDPVIDNDRDRLEAVSVLAFAGMVRSGPPQGAASLERFARGFCKAMMGKQVETTGVVCRNHRGDMVEHPLKSPVVIRLRQNGFASTVVPGSDDTIRTSFGFDDVEGELELPHGVIPLYVLGPSFRLDGWIEPGQIMIGQVEFTPSPTRHFTDGEARRTRIAKALLDVAPGSTAVPA